MASNSKPLTASAALLLFLSLLFFSTDMVSSAATSCPINTLRLGACANLLGGLVGVTVGSPAPHTDHCCSLIDGLVDLEAAVCLCTALKADILGIINVSIPVALDLMLNRCGRTTPSDFQCRN